MLPARLIVALRKKYVLHFSIFAEKIIRNIIDMTKVNKELDPQLQSSEAPEETVEEARPNRDEYSRMWSEDNDDIDFEDKEARYGRAIEDRNELRERRKADASLGKLFDEHEWLAVMASELRDNPDLDPFEWLEGFCNENDVSINEILDEPEARKRLTAKIAERQKENADKLAKSENIKSNLNKSYEAIAKAFPDKSPEEVDELWLKFWQIIEQAEEGVVDTKTMTDFAHALSYEEDIENARAEGGMAARNEKIQNNVRRPSEDMDKMPPTLNQGMSAATKKEVPQKKSFAKTIFEDI